MFFYKLSGVTYFLNITLHIRNRALGRYDIVALEKHLSLNLS